MTCNSVNYSKVSTLCVLFGGVLQYSEIEGKPKMLECSSRSHQEQKAKFR